jgi:prophage tail gpP-like protein
VTQSAEPIGTRDVVELTLEGERVLVAESYQVRRSMLSQPASWSIRMGWGGVISDLMERFPPASRFQIRVNGQLQQSGRLDGFEVTADDNGASMTLRGRDAIAPLFDAYVENDVSFKNVTYEQLTLRAMKECAIDGKLLTTNKDSRSKMVGKPVTETAQPTASSKVTKPPSGPIQARVGDRWFEFLRKHYDRAGLVLWADGEGNLILSNPNGSQAPTYRIVRQRGLTRNAVNVISAHLRNDTAKRHSEAIVYGRGGGKKFGRTKATGSLVDDEMRNYGFQRPLVIRDNDTTDLVQAERLAERRIADSRRQGYSLTYTVSGHVLPAIGGGVAVIVPDTVAEVVDDELGIRGAWYVESVTFSRPPTTTEIVLMRPKDLIFGE